MEDVKKLDEWRRRYWDADLEVPHDFNTPDGNVESSVATKNGKMFASLTGVNSVTLDPFIHDPEADPTDILFALVKLETVLTNNAMKRGAVDAYIAIPKQLTHYIRLLGNYGYEPTVENCVILRRPLTPDTVPLLGVEREKLLAEIKAAKSAQEAEIKEVGGEKVEYKKVPTDHDPHVH